MQSCGFVVAAKLPKMSQKQNNQLCAKIMMEPRVFLTLVKHVKSNVTHNMFSKCIICYFTHINFSAKTDIPLQDLRFSQR
jgi:hypothetical protein